MNLCSVCEKPIIKSIEVCETCQGDMLDELDTDLLPCDIHFMINENDEEGYHHG